MTALYRVHADTVYRVCFTCMKGHRMDAEDALQATFLALMRCGKRFESAAHEKAWLIVTASNVCKNSAQAQPPEGRAARYGCAGAARRTGG